MKMISIKKSDWADAMKKVQESYALAGPVKDKGGHTFRELGKEEIPDLEYTETKMSPKEVVLPKTEVMFTYTLDTKKEGHHILEEVPFDKTPRAAVGIRPYDAKAIEILKKNFENDEYKDPYFLNKYENLTLVGLAENNPLKVNFSTSCNTGPFDEACLDIILVESGDEYIGKVLTEKGEKFAAAAGFAEGDSGIETKIEELKKEAEAKIKSSVSFDKIEKMSVLDLHDAPFWEEVGFACINCGTCTYACPTCWCFDIQDEAKGSEGVRVRNWDTCMSEVYSVHTTGHDPRHEDWQRTRNRFMHKLKYYLDKYEDGIMCVGCGRCVNQCPVNIDIREVCQQMNDYEPSK
ncbi:MAG: 4Fe-4S dicluster domain-containing protein [Thermodesulfobacteriota bacterium]